MNVLVCPICGEKTFINVYDDGMMAVCGICGYHGLDVAFKGFAPREYNNLGLVAPKWKGIIFEAIKAYESTLPAGTAVPRSVLSDFAKYLIAGLNSTEPIEMD
jgi:hypothetical protein